MIIYRPHRGSLVEAMKESKVFNTEDEMKQHIVETWHNNIDTKDIIIESKSYNDDRNGWKDTRYVCTKRMGKENYIKEYECPQCIGMCATDFDYKEE